MNIELNINSISFLTDLNEEKFQLTFLKEVIASDTYKV